MPYARRTSRKRPLRRKGRVNASVAVRKYVKSAIKRSAETKNMCISNLTGISVNSTGTALSTFTIPQGDTSRSRDGDFVNATSLRVKYVLQADATDKQNVMRVMIIQSKKGLLTPFAAPGWFKCHTKEMLATYTVLYDKSHIVNSQNGTQQTWSGPFYVNIPDKRLRILQWTPTTVTNTEPNVKGAVYIFVYSSSQIAPSPKMLYEYQMQYQEK